MKPSTILVTLLALVLACVLGMAWAAGAWTGPTWQFPCPRQESAETPSLD